MRKTKHRAIKKYKNIFLAAILAATVFLQGIPAFADDADPGAEETGTEFTSEISEPVTDPSEEGSGDLSAGENGETDPETGLEDGQTGETEDPADDPSDPETDPSETEDPGEDTGDGTETEDPGTEEEPGEEDPDAEDPEEDPEAEPEEPGGEEGTEDPSGPEEKTETDGETEEDKKTEKDDETETGKKTTDKDKKKKDKEDDDEEDEDKEKEKKDYSWDIDALTANPIYSLTADELKICSILEARGMNMAQKAAMAAYLTSDFGSEPESYRNWCEKRDRDPEQIENRLEAFYGTTSLRAMTLPDEEFLRAKQEIKEQKARGEERDPKSLAIAKNAAEDVQDGSKGLIEEPEESKTIKKPANAYWKWLSCETAEDAAKALFDLAKEYENPSLTKKDRKALTESAEAYYEIFTSGADFEYLYNTNGVPYMCQAYYEHVPYDEGVVQDHGCGVTAFSMVASYFTGITLDPTVTGTWSYLNSVNAVQSWGAFGELADRYGITMTGWYGGYEDIAAAELEEGHLVIVSLDKDGYFCNSDEGHYILVTGISEDGLYYVSDPSTPERTIAGPYTGEQVFGCAKQCWAFGH